MKILIAASNMVHIKNFHMPYIKALREQGHSVYVMASGEEADFNIGFKKRTLSFKNFLLISKIRKIIKKEGFDAIYLHTTLAAFYVRLALKGIKNRPYVFNTVHGYLFSKNSSFLKRTVYLACEKLVRAQTDDIAVMNGEDYEIASENNLCLGKVYFINGMGVSFDRFKRADRAKEGKELCLTFIGEISKRKNQIFLVDAVKSMENARLVLVGDGPMRKSVIKRAKRLGIEDRVEITGFTRDVYPYLEKTDIYVSASSIEGLPFNIIEAMFSSLPIVASDIKGHRDLLPKECLFDFNNIYSFKEAIALSKSQESNYSIEKYSLDKVLKENISIYLSHFNNETN